MLAQGANNNNGCPELEQPSNQILSRQANDDIDCDIPHNPSPIFLKAIQSKNNCRYPVYSAYSCPAQPISMNK